MPNLCARCGSQVSYFGRRFAHHRWFCNSDCLASWQSGDPEVKAAVYRSTKPQQICRSVRQAILRGVVGAAAVLLALAASLLFLLMIGGMECIARYGWWVGLAWMAVIAALCLLASGLWYVYRRL